MFCYLFPSWSMFSCYIFQREMLYYLFLHDRLRFVYSYLRYFHCLLPRMSSTVSALTEWCFYMLPHCQFWIGKWECSFFFSCSRFVCINLNTKFSLSVSSYILITTGMAQLVRALVSHQCGPLSIPPGAICGLNLFLLRGFFSRLSTFSPSTKTNTLNPNSTRIDVLMWLPL